MIDESWRVDALCSQVGWDLWFPEKGENTGGTAKKVCARCPVVEDCLEYALGSWQHYGVWGGKSPKELADIRRDRGMVHPLTPEHLRPGRAA